MTRPKEKGQHAKGVHHSDVSELVLRGAYEGDRLSKSMGTLETRCRGGGVKGQKFYPWLAKWVNIQEEKTWLYLSFRIISKIGTTSHPIYTLNVSTSLYGRDIFEMNLSKRSNKTNWMLNFCTNSKMTIVVFNHRRFHRNTIISQDNNTA